MKFFKHFVDAHEGRSMQSLMTDYGLQGYAMYFILMELCAGKLEKAEHEEFSDQHVWFSFNERILRERLRLRFPKLVEFLNACSDLDLFEWGVSAENIKEKLVRSSLEVEQKLSTSCTLVELQINKNSQEFHFYVPKLLECLDRDAKRARADRGQTAPKIKIKKKNIYAHEISKEEGDWRDPAFNTCFEFFQKTVFDRRGQKIPAGANAIKRFKEQIQTEDQARRFYLAVEKYGDDLDRNDWKQPKQTFQTFLGTKKAPFWTQYAEAQTLSEPELEP